LAARAAAQIDRAREGDAEGALRRDPDVVAGEVAEIIQPVEHPESAVGDIQAAESPGCATVAPPIAEPREGTSDVDVATDRAHHRTT
jgi:hypothetical protein